jgi:hypothetical protein
MRIPHLTPYLPVFLQRSTALREFVYFGFKQAWACIFGGLLLAGILGTGLFFPEIGISRYDFLFIYALSIQACLIIFKLESWREIAVILLFHAMATAMELFKTSDGIGSWNYPEDSVMRIGNVPWFTGFMYSAIGSYMARAWRIFDFISRLRQLFHPSLSRRYSLAVDCDRRFSLRKNKDPFHTEIRDSKHALVVGFLSCRGIHLLGRKSRNPRTRLAIPGSGARMETRPFLQIHRMVSPHATLLHPHLRPEATGIQVKESE